MKKQMMLFALLFCCFSCVSQKREIIAKSTIKLEGKNTNIRDLIEIDGYYSSLEHRTKGGTMFFEDGIFVNFSFDIDVSEEDIKANMSKSVAGRIKNNQLQWGSWLGVYTIEGDTIIVHYYMRGSWWTPWYASEVRFKVIDRTTILPIYLRDFLLTEEQYYKEYNRSPWIKNKIACFHPANSLPSSDCWLKEEKWIWRNESNWKNYMKMIEQKKANKK
ncbi:hypothetical protein FACS189413_14060 [Bacteroidia bacterium]|nr:hypothetical protein FACS189413_14060 [Bacteroidia bacterium]